MSYNCLIHRVGLFVAVASYSLLGSDRALLQVPVEIQETYATRGSVVELALDEVILAKNGIRLSVARDGETIAGPTISLTETGSDTPINAIVSNGVYRGLLGGTVLVADDLITLAGLSETVYETNRLFLALDLEGGLDHEFVLVADRGWRTGVFGVDETNSEFDVERGLLSISGRLYLTESMARKLGAPGLSGISIGAVTIEMVMVLVETREYTPEATLESVTMRTMPTAAGGFPSSGPDVIVGDLPATAQQGRTGTPGSGTVGISVGTTSCNKGNVDFNWFQLPLLDHPVIPQNLYRLHTVDGSERFEQVGASWMKHGFFAINANFCQFGCIDANAGGTKLGVGCSDPYNVGRNGGHCGLGARSHVNPYTGVMTGGSNQGGAPCGGNYPSRNHGGHTHDGIAHRCQVQDVDLMPSMNAGARYFIEGQYITPHEFNDTQAFANQNMNNNVSYREVSVTEPAAGSFSFGNVGATVREQAGVQAWTGAGSTLIEPAFQVDGRAFVYWKVTDLGNQTWHYEYAVYNEHLDRSIQAFSIPIPSGVVVNNAEFHAPRNHNDPGVAASEQYSNMPWTFTSNGGTATWESETFAQNTQANAIRFGTLYNFRFDANSPPVNINSTVGFFKTGGSMNVATQGPQAVGPQDCNLNGIEDSLEIASGLATDCDNNGRPDDCDTLNPMHARRVAAGLSSPVGVYAPPGDTGRLFIIEQGGLVKILDLVTETVNPVAYLNISSLTNGGGEQGLLGLAFHPNFQADPRFYVNYTNTGGDTVIAEYSAASAAANTANPAGNILLTVGQPFSNHNGGGMHFGPDGFLYVATGDGGSFDDPGNRSQNLSVLPDNELLLGKMLRLNVDNPPGYIAVGNPFGNEIWAYGLRNPWRFSFDRLLGDMYIGDVGQDAREEIDFEPAGFAGGGNYGWDCKEGSIATPTNNNGYGCVATNPTLIDPIHEIAHPVLGVCSITGGHVYRGCAISGLSGTYFYSDLCGNFIRTFRYDSTSGVVSELTDRTLELTPDIGSMTSVVSFGEDGEGELYVVSHGGDIFKIECDTCGPQCGNGVLEPGEACDDGNPFSGDGCSSTCINENCGFCGDGILSNTEQCDDGNNAPGDGCSATCTTESADFCADAGPISEGSWSFDTNGMGTDGPSHLGAGCAFDGQTYHDIWYQYTAPCSGNLSVDICNSGYDTDLVVYDGCVCPTNSNTLLGCNDDHCGTQGFRSQLPSTGDGDANGQAYPQISVTGGNCYLIRVGGWNDGSQGVGTITIGNSGSPCAACGNGILEGCEECDDNNIVPGDGCDENCLIEVSDCDFNGISDADEIANCTGDPECADCNTNGTPDGCEIVADPTVDCEGGPVGVIMDGETTFVSNNCLFCHSIDGSGGTGPNIQGKSRVVIWNKIGADGTHPGGQFPQFTQQDFANIEAYLSQFPTPRGSRGRPDEILDACQGPFADCDTDGATDACELEAGTQVDVGYNGVPDDCEGCMSNPECDDSQFCNGAETCVSQSCIAGADPCPGQLCDEIANTCVDCLNNGDCDDGLFCNGAEICNLGACQSGTSPCVPGVFCIESRDACVDCVVDTHCDDGAYCTGVETCVNDLCVAGSDPCPGLACDEGADACLCNDNGDCNDLVFCNGAEFCDVSGQCQSGALPCNPGDICDETGTACLSASRMFLVPAGTDPSVTTPGENLEIVVNAGDRLTVEVFLENQLVPLETYNAGFGCSYASSEGALGASLVIGSTNIDSGRTDYIFSGINAFQAVDQGQCDSSIPCSSSANCPEEHPSCVDTDNDQVPDHCATFPARVAGVSFAGKVAFTDPRYLGSVQYDLPTSARGQYAIGFVCTPDDGCALSATMIENSTAPLPFTSDGLIVSIAVGRCCLQDDADPELECFELTLTECAALGGTFNIGTCDGLDPCGCQTDCDCVFPFIGGISLGSNTCLQQTCGVSGCEELVTRYGDVAEPFGGFVATSDILCAVTAFGNYCDCPNADIAGCLVSGIPIGTDDILAIVDAFGGDDPCGCEIPMGGPVAASQDEAIVFQAPVKFVADDDPGVITLVPRNRNVGVGETILVDAYVSGVNQLTGYQLSLTAEQLRRDRLAEPTRLTLLSQRVQDAHGDYVFAGSESIPLVDSEGGRFGAVTLDAGTDVNANKRAYLGTFEFEAPSVGGQVVISVRMDATGLWKSSIESIALDPVKSVVITVVQGERRLGAR